MPALIIVNPVVRALKDVCFLGSFVLRGGAVRSVGVRADAAGSHGCSMVKGGLAFKHQVAAPL